MLAQDVKPDRLSRAKLAVHDLLDKLNGDGVGLVAFAGNAFLQCPVTLDYDAFRESLDALDTKVIQRGGTDIAAAIREAEAVFKTRTAAEKILVLITDGEDLGGMPKRRRRPVKIFAVGVGNTGEPVPVLVRMAEPLCRDAWPVGEVVPTKPRSSKSLKRQAAYISHSASWAKD
jgi:Ca-activated chloride channel family protein